MNIALDITMLTTSNEILTFNTDGYLIYTKYIKNKCHNKFNQIRK